MSTCERADGFAVSDPFRPAWYRLNRMLRETHDTFTMELVGGGHEPFHFAPGQFNMLYVFGVGEAPISISGDPANEEKIVHTVRTVGTVTKAMRKLARNDPIGVRGPFGTCWPLEQARGQDVVLVTGGIGLAPLRPAIYHLLSHREDYGRIVLLYGARTPEDILYHEELQTWRGRLDMDVEVTVDRAEGPWRGNVGVVTTLIPRALFDPARALAMICGPEVMMRFTIQALRQRGMDRHQVFVSMERNMQCAVGLCGHCQYGPNFICKNGPVFRYEDVEPLFSIREV